MGKSRRRRERGLAPRHERRDSALPHTVSADGERHLAADATTEKRWLTGCRGKKPYDTERVALKVAGEYESESGVPMKPYHCGFCDRWHLTTDHHRTRYAHDLIGMIIWRLEQHLRERGITA